MIENKKLIEEIGEATKKVFAYLGSGHSEDVYEKALEVELRNRKIPYESQVVIPIMYENSFVGFGRADLIIDKQIIVELKAITSLGIGDRMQLNVYLDCYNYLQGILINFPQPSRNNGAINKVEMEVLDKEK